MLNLPSRLPFTSIPGTRHLSFEQAQAAEEAALSAETA